MNALAQRGWGDQKLDNALVSAAAERGALRIAARTRKGYPRFDVAEVDQDLAKLVCRARGCDRLALGESQVCRDHVSAQLLTGRQASPEARARMSTSHAGKRLSLDHRQAISATLTLLEERTCPQCRKPFKPRVSEQVCCGLSCSSARRWTIEDRDARRRAVRLAVRISTVAPSQQRACQRCGGDLGVIRGSRIAAGKDRFHLECWHAELPEWWKSPSHDARRWRALWYRRRFGSMAWFTSLGVGVEVAAERGKSMGRRRVLTAPEVAIAARLPAGRVGLPAHRREVQLPAPARGGCLTHGGEAGRLTPGRPCGVTKVRASL